MSEKTREVPQLADTTYAHTLVIKSTHEYKVLGPYGSNFPGTMAPIALLPDSTPVKALLAKVVIPWY